MLRIDLVMPAFFITSMCSSGPHAWECELLLQDAKLVGTHRYDGPAIWILIAILDQILSVSRWYGMTMDVDAV